VSQSVIVLVIKPQRPFAVQMCFFPFKIQISEISISYLISFIIYRRLAS